MKNQSPVFGVAHNVFMMGIVSLFNDIASEMIYPIIPLFLTATLGTPMPIVGLIEGVAESLSSFLKVLSGWLSDRFRTRKPFVVAGYSMSTIAKLLFGFAYSWHLVFAGRTLDRLGKGIRTSARDALISESSGPRARGRSFGFHRALDNVGAIIGPLLSLLLLAVFTNNLRTIFFLAFIPGFIGILFLIFFVNDAKQEPTSFPAHSFWNWRSLGKPFIVFIIISIIFGLGNSAEAFLVLRAKNLGLSLTLTILTYVLSNVTYSLLSAPAGIISDKIGPRKVLIAGLLIFSIVYGSFGLITNSAYLWLLFPLYGTYLALTDGVSKAYISQLVPSEHLATAYGIYQMAMGTCILIASFAAGILWAHVNVIAPFLFGSIMSLLSAILFFLAKPKPSQALSSIK